MIPPVGAGAEIVRLRLPGGGDTGMESVFGLNAAVTVTFALATSGEYPQGSQSRGPARERQSPDWRALHDARRGGENGVPRPHHQEIPRQLGTRGVTSYTFKLNA